MKHANIPVFIPHEGCTKACVFCDQRAITGVREKADRDIRPEIDHALSHLTLAPENIQIAFFGGSFTGIDRALMVRLLEDAYAYVKDGRVGSLRLSTRPDYISPDILDLLKSHGVRSIELGLQSLCDPVLTLSGRGHTVRDAERACALICAYGFELVGQMMLGLPGSTLEDELYTARRIVSLGCRAARIYPTVVFENTELCRMAKSGTYTPLDVEEAVRRGAEVLDVFVQNSIRVLRIGLQKNETASESRVYGGANHSALGERIESAYYYRLLERLYDTDASPVVSDRLTIFCAPGEQSKVSGQKKENRRRLARKLFGSDRAVHRIRIQPDPSLAPYTLRIRREYTTQDRP